MVVFEWLAKMIFSHVNNMVFFTCFQKYFQKLEALQFYLQAVSPTMDEDAVGIILRCQYLGSVSKVSVFSLASKQK